MWLPGIALRAQPELRYRKNLRPVRPNAAISQNASTAMTSQVPAMPQKRPDDSFDVRDTPAAAKLAAQQRNARTERQQE